LKQGAGFASRFYNYYPSYVLAMTLTNTNYFAPSSAPFSVEELIELTQRAHGYGIFWYWHLFTSDEAPQLMSDHIDTLWSILHGSGKTWLKTFCKENGFRDALVEDHRKAVRPYATEEMKKEWVAKVQAENGLRLKASLMWYRALAKGFQDEANKEATKNLAVSVPYLLLRAEDDVCCKGEDHEALKKAGLLGEDAEMEVMGEAGHWVMLSHPKEYGEKIVSWLKAKGF
jgi:soluble epoxide hydrolase/lipid-phosphate phosphatase